MVEDIRILCMACIEQYSRKEREDVLPATTVYHGEAYCWHHLERAIPALNLIVEFDKSTYPPSYAISRK